MTELELTLTFPSGDRSAYTTQLRSTTSWSVDDRADYGLIIIEQTYNDSVKVNQWIQENPNTSDEWFRGVTESGAYGWVLLAFAYEADIENVVDPELKYTSGDYVVDDTDLYQWNGSSFVESDPQTYDFTDHDNQTWNPNGSTFKTFQERLTIEPSEDFHLERYLLKAIKEKPNRNPVDVRVALINTSIDKFNDNDPKRADDICEYLNAVKEQTN